MRTMWMALAIAAVAGSAAAKDAGPVVVTPAWMSTPSADDIAGVYPQAAARVGASGRAVISCQVTAEGALGGCAVAQESPAAMGFGGAALKLADRFRMRATSWEGLPLVGARVNIPIRFELKR
jgi:protein TonB